MVRIRYIGEQLIARAFDHNFHRKHWDDKHGMDAAQVSILTSNPQFEVEGAAQTYDASNGAAQTGSVG